jgi:hypothetical protein
MPTERQYDDIACKAAAAVESLRLALHYAAGVDDKAHAMLHDAWTDMRIVVQYARDAANALRSEAAGNVTQPR